MHSHYSLTKRSDGWVICVDGAMLLVCARRKIALRAIRDAIAHDLSSIATADAIVAATHGGPHDDDDLDADTTCQGPHAAPKRAAVSSYS